MKIIFSDQYKRAAVVIEPGDTLVDVEHTCHFEGATYTEQEPDDCCIVQFPGRPIEVYTWSALRRTMNATTPECDHPGGTDAIR